MTTVPASPAPTINVTSTLQTIWDDAGMKIVYAALIALWPPLATIFAIPVVGPVLQWVVTYFGNKLVDGMIALGVIDLKIVMIDLLDAAAQAKWANELVILKQVRAAGAVLTPEQQAAFDVALQQLGENHTGIINA